MRKPPPTHGTFIQKLTECRLVYEHHLISKSWRKTGKHFGESSRKMRTCGDFYFRHKDDRTQPALADVPNKTVRAMTTYFAINDMEGTREQLIRNHHSVNGMVSSRTKIPKQFIRVMMKHSGLEWFEKNGKPVIHWKHQPKTLKEQHGK